MHNEHKPNFDLIDDLVFFINNDTEFYRKSYFPVESKFINSYKNNKTISAKFFIPIVKKAYSIYKDQYDVHGLPSELSIDNLKEICLKLKQQEIEDIKKQSVSEDLQALRKLAGITEPTHVRVNGTNNAKIMREQNIKPGSNDWFDLWFPLKTDTFPTGFRGRRK
jgi:hypothetical protein